MTTVTQLIAYLETLPKDTEVIVAESYYGYEPGTRWVDLDLDEYMGNADFNPSGGTNTLYLGNA